MSRFLFATFGSLGDLHPYIAVARVLIDRGHDAVIATQEDYRATVEYNGIEFVPISPCMDELGDRQTTINRLFDIRHGPEYLIRHLVMPYLRPVFEQLLQAAAGADLLISHPLTVTLPLVAERRQLPWVASVLSPMSFMSCYDPPVVPVAPWVRKLRCLGPTPYCLLFNLMKLSVKNWEAPLRDFRQQMGFARSTQSALFEGQFSPLLNLALFDPQLAQPQPDWPANTRVCGSPLFDGAVQDDSSVSELEKFLAEGDAPIVFALGSSAVWVAGDFWDKAAAAVRQLGRRAVLITGPTIPQALPVGVKAFAYLPYSSIFPRAAVIVHQAGIGTLAQAMRAGRPQLSVPVAFDQPDNARRVQAMGLSRTLPFRKVTAQRLASELAVLISGPGYTETARTIAEELKIIDGAATAADLLSGLIVA